MAQKKPSASKSKGKKKATVSKQKQSASPAKSRFLWWSVKWLMAFAIWGAIALGIVLAWYAQDLPDIRDLSMPDRRPSITIEAEDGTTIATYGHTFGEYIGFEEIPDHLIEAVLATEDRRFFYHFGLDVIGLVRAMAVNLKAGHIVQGGSTITQQLAKNLFLSPERTLKRKIQEVLLAFSLERRFTKQEIFALYLNRVYLGAGTYGVDAAAHRYFGKKVQELSLSESAMLAGLLKAPSRYSPASNKELAQKRAEQVLLNMVDAGALSSVRAEDARKHPAEVKTIGGESRNAYYFADWVAEQIPDYVSNLEEDIIVRTTLDAALQASADKALRATLDEQGAARNVSQAAVVTMQSDGAIKAMIGGRNYVESQYNRATQAQRQPGSAFKVFVYGAALEAGYTPYDRMEDAPITIGKWNPQNYGHKYRGMVTLQEALAESLNTVAVRLSETVGRDRVIDFAETLGVEVPLRDHPSIALGTSETSLLRLTTAYAHIAAQGRAVYPYTITEIKTVITGEVLYHRVETPTAQVIPPQVASILTGMLQAVVETGTGRRAAIGRPAAGKTGTSQDFRDAWFIGFTPELVTGVWMGNDNTAPMNKVSGGSLPAGLWGEVMQTALSGKPVHGFGQVFTPGDDLLPWQKREGSRDYPTESIWDSFFRKLERLGEGGLPVPEKEIDYSYPSPRRN